MKTKFRLPKGTYYIGDPSHVLDEELQEKFLFKQRVNYGEGLYFDNQGRGIIVNSFLGICSIDTLKKLNPSFFQIQNYSEYKNLKFILEYYPEDFDVIFSNEDPTHTFGNVIFFTEDFYKEKEED